MLHKNLGLKPSWRAVAMNMNSETGLTGLIRLSNHVDVLVSTESEPDGSGHAVVVLQDAQMLATSNLPPRERKAIAGAMGRLLPSGQLTSDMVVVLDRTGERGSSG